MYKYYFLILIMIKRMIERGINEMEFFLDDSLFKLTSRGVNDVRSINSTFINNFWIENDFNKCVEKFDNDFKVEIKILYLKYPEKIYKVQVSVNISFT